MYQLSVTVLFFILAQGSARAADNPQVIDWPIQKAYMAAGFDNNDRLQITVAGIYPDTAYRVGPYRVAVDGLHKAIVIDQKAYHYTGLSLPMTVPFDQTVDVGIVRDSGDYTVWDGYSGRRLGMVSVALAQSEGQDDFFYAPITDAYVRQDRLTAHNTLVLEGNFSDRCTRLKGEPVIHYYENSIVVQPIAEHLGRTNCEAAQLRFRKEVALKGLEGTYLLHVRSLNGQAINKLVYFAPEGIARLDLGQ